MITLEKVCFAYEHEVALRYVNLQIEKGDSVVIQGPNGCGKSTLIRLLNGIIYPSEGHYFYNDHEITEKALKDRQFAKWFHQQMGLSETEIRQRTEDCLQLFGIEKLRERPPYHLSGGEKRKVSLACILSLNLEVLILDEPLAGLDEKTQDMLLEFLKNFHRAGKTLITITHNRHLAETIGSRFAVMNEDHELKMI